MLLGVVVDGEIVTTFEWLAAAVIVAGVVLVMTERRH